MNNERVFVREIFAEAFEPKELTDVPEWVEANVVLPAGASSHSGRYSLSVVPYLEEVYRCLGSDSNYTTITLLKSSQVGVSTAAFSFVLYSMDQQPDNILYIMPSEDALKNLSQDMFDPVMESCPALEGKVGSAGKDTNNIKTKRFQGGSIKFATANSTAQLKTRPARYVILDEMSEYAHDVNSQGDPVSIAKARTVTYGKKKRIFQLSTPTIAGLDRTEQEFFKSDQRYYFVPCPHCGHMSPLIFRDAPFDSDDIKWKVVAWDKGEDGEHLPESAHLVCGACEGRIEERHKYQMIDPAHGAEWRATAKGEFGHAGFHISTLYSPRTTWAEIVRKFLTANEEKKKGNKEELKTFLNHYLGVSWKDESTEVDISSVYRKRQQYTAEVPHDVCVLTLGGDTQPDRIEVSVWGWTVNGSAYLIDHRVFRGDPQNPSSPCYEQLGDVIDHKTYLHESGKRLPIAYGVIDEGGGTWQTHLRHFCRMNGRGDRFFTGKGASHDEKAPAWRGSRDSKTGTHHLMIGTCMVKKRLFEVMNNDDPSLAMLHLPISDFCDVGFCDQLTCETIGYRYTKDGKLREKVITPRGARNEAIDCFCYAYAILSYFNPNLKAVRLRFGLDEIEATSQEDSAPVDREQQVEEQIILSRQRQKDQVIMPNMRSRFVGGRYNRDKW